MQRFKSFIAEQHVLTEAEGDASADTKGKLHEILTGFHLRGNKHMLKHPDKEGDTPKQAHEKLKETIAPIEHKKINTRAKSAAADIKKKVETHGHKIHDVSWTSKPGDLHRATGIHASQKEDTSDIVVHTKNSRGNVKHHGISLKVSDKTKHVPISNPGMESTGGAEKHLEAHKKHILEKFPHLKGMGVKERKEHMRNNPKLNEYVRSKNTETLTKMAKHLGEHLNSLPTHKLAEHIRTHVLAANPTPMQKAGHNHMRHTTYETKTGIHHHSIVPSEHYEHILKDHKNLTVLHNGSRVAFFHKGRQFATHGLKFKSQSDPLGHVGGRTQSPGAPIHEDEKD